MAFANLATVSLPSAVPPVLVGLLDDAATFPPDNAAMADAAAAHAEHRRAWYADLVGPFVVSDQRLPELAGVLRDHEPVADSPESDAPAVPLAVSVVVSGGAGALEPALGWADRAEGLDLRSVEVAVRDDAGTPDGLAHNATRITTALGTWPAPVTAYVEMPPLRGPDPTADWLRGLDVLAAADVAVKLRTGGQSADAHPSEAELVATIDAVLDRELGFKTTAGLHHAVRSTSPDGWEQHGFLNVLGATAVLLRGDGRSRAERVLAERDPGVLVEAVSAWPVEPTARRWFRSFGSCSVVDPVDDLVALGLLIVP